jgi:hypothetical protein
MYVKMSLISHAMGYVYEGLSYTILPKMNNMETDLKKIIEEIALKKIIHHLPQASAYQSKIKFHHAGHKASMDLDQLPPEMARQIAEMFE